MNMSDLENSYVDDKCKLLGENDIIQLRHTK